MRCSAKCGRPARVGVPVGDVVTRMLCWPCAVAELLAQAGARIIGPRPLRAL